MSKKMIEITHRQTVALKAAVKVLESEGWEDPLLCWRGIGPSPYEMQTIVQVRFWVGENPKFLKDVYVRLLETPKRWIPKEAALYGPEIVDFKEVEHLWSFQDGNPIKIN